MSLKCPFARGRTDDAERPSDQLQDERKKDDEGVDDGKPAKERDSSRGMPASKCPLGYDSGSFKLGPLSCVICRALLFDSSKCIPCGHLYCRFCISRFHDCPLCGADIEHIEADSNLQKQVEQFIEGHARIKRSNPESDETGGKQEHKKESDVTYEDVSLARGTFLLQHAMRAFQAQNLESANSRLGICANDIRDELERSGATPDVCSQLGAVLGMLGDCRRSMGDTEGAFKYYNETVEMLSSLPEKNTEVVHALSVSLNKLGDLKYYAEDLQSARTFYIRALQVRKNALTDFTELSSEVLDVAVSLAKVADVDRALGDNTSAKDRFQEGMKTLQNLSTNSKDTESLERRRLSIFEFLHSQLKGGM